MSHANFISKVYTLLSQNTAPVRSSDHDSSVAAGRDTVERVPNIGQHGMRAAAPRTAIGPAGGGTGPNADQRTFGATLGARR